MATHFTSDLHIFHSNIIKFTNRPWTLEEQTEEIIRRWNAQAGPNDSVYHLGDFTFTGVKRFEEIWDIITRLNGKKYFIHGNHDNMNLWKLIEQRTEDEGRDDIIVLGHYHEMKINKQNITLCHYSMREWNKKPYGAIMLFGHSHGDLHIDGERTMDVGIDNHPEHRLFSWAEIEERMLAIPTPNECHHGKPL